ncbi:aminoacyl-tRNA hydrolase [Limnochorda pilosa]|uniref:Peptidyl-tRNA hydrolase n=1 Tax=Limnochorda pilosa TaxID=1555112 RepID=A0A0K2SQK1_LIMPI|nr:aminoacyl-tRNA hydrolase [Limnochorda pilosa]BAS29405.1 peptidyl-tRNA hydrolase [Limnochorda pilosa]
MRMVVGLGNPGSRYHRTRHNVGFEVVERLASRLGARAWRDARLASTLTADLEGEELLLVRPLTFMNESGRAVARHRPQQLPLERLMLVADDVHLPLGTLRMRAGGSAGGHNGLRSVEAHLGSQAYPRLRVGVGDPGDPGRMVDHVLGRFTAVEWRTLEAALERAVDAILCWARDGIGPAMSRYNGPVEVAKEAPEGA